ncbi:MAG TPA: hypothetical protein VHA35_19625 [Dongiaceae bacterium]|jgi:hypothetical protein|nr:hypothetical protein [Dongiaceae bacterium]
MKTFLAHSRFAVAAVCLFSLSACVVDGPPGPTVPVMPGDNKTLGQFQQDDATCRSFAAQQTGISPTAAAQQAGVGTAVVSTLVGAAVGALIGTAAGNPAIGAAIGGGAGLLTGAAAGTGNAAISAGNVQQRYDIAYQQCMQTTGNKTVLAQSVPPPAPPPAYAAPAPAPTYYYPPPPAYYYPPPAYYYYPPPPVYYYPPPPAYYAPGIGFGATFIFGGGHRWHHH